MSADCLFILRSVPTRGGPSIGLDSTLAAAALDRKVCLLLTDARILEALSQSVEGEDLGPLSLLRAADLFGIDRVAILLPKKKPSSSLPQLPVPVASIAPSDLAKFVGGFTQVFSYP